MPTEGDRAIDDESLPTVSVVVPTYNRRDLLLRTLDALDAQTYPHDRIDVVVVDDGSTDGTARAIAARPTKLVLQVVGNESQTSAAQARNVGVARATGEIVAFTDSDCRPTPGWIEALVAAFEPGIGIVQGRTTADPAQPVGPRSRSQWVPHEYGLYETSNIAYRRDVLGIDPFDTEIPARLREVLGERIGRQPFGEDTELAWRIKRRGHRSTFAVDAVVHHHVFEADLWYLLRRSALTAGFPVLVGLVPELREVFLRHSVLLNGRRLRWWVLCAGLAVSRRRRAALLLAAPYLGAVLGTGPGLGRRLRGAPITLLLDTVETVALVYGSIRARRAVL